MQQFRQQCSKIDKPENIKKKKKKSYKRQLNFKIQNKRKVYCIGRSVDAFLHTPYICMNVYSLHLEMVMQVNPLFVCQRADPAYKQWMNVHSMRY